MKKIFVFGLLAFTLIAAASEPIEKESMDDAEKFKFENAVEEKTGGRAFAGSKAKKENAEVEETEEEIQTTKRSEVRYWRYSE